MEVVLHNSSNSYKSNNVFISISKRWRKLIALYIIVWQIIPTVVNQTNQIFASNITNIDHYILLILVLKMTNEILWLIPFFINRISSTPIGWLHPLVLPTIIGIGTSLATSPENLLNPFLVWFQNDISMLDDTFLSRLSISETAILEGYIQRELLNLLATISMYIGFIFINIKAPNFTVFTPQNTKLKVIIAFTIIFCVFIVFLQSSGGLIAHLTSLAGGRHVALGDAGHFMVIINFASTMMIVWYFFDKKATNYITFWILLVASSVMQFLASASRSDALLPFMFLVIVFIFHNKKIPIIKIITIAFISFILIGPLLQIRQSGRAGEADLRAITEFNLRQAIEQTQEDIDARGSRSASLAVMTLVPERVDYLWGRTYISAIAFWIPRTIWPEKPRGSGAHVGALIYSGQDTALGYDGGGVPPGAMAEAYWNFSVPGVILVFLLYGTYRRWLANIFIRNCSKPGAVSFSLLSIMTLRSPTTIIIVPYLQLVVLLLIFYLWLGVLRFRLIKHEFR